MPSRLSSLGYVVDVDVVDVDVAHVDIGGVNRTFLKIRLSFWEWWTACEGFDLGSNNVDR